MLVQGNAYAGEGGTRFSCCRYGNVVGSRGSVIPLFRQQREQGLLTVTDANMTRFWLTLDQGVKFVLNSIDRMTGGEIFVPKLPSMKIANLARAIAPECTIKYIGARPGEKTHEILISEDEARHTLELPDSYVIQSYNNSGRDLNVDDAKPMASGFLYASDTNPWKLSESDLVELIG